MDIKKEHGTGRKTKFITKSDLPVEAIVAVKALLLYVFFVHYGMVKPGAYDLPFLPFMGILNAIPSFVYQLASIALLAAVLVPFVVKDFYRESAFIAGIIILFFIFSSKPIFSNSLTFTACLLVLIGLYRGTSYLFRIQISILFLGAGLNKLFTSDWWNGRYIDHFMRDIYNVGLYHSYVPEEMLTIAVLIGISVIFTELLLALFVLIPRYTRLTIYLGLLFFGGMLLVTKGTLSLRFFYLMSVAFLLISSLQMNHITIIQRSGFFAVLIKFLDLSDAIKSVVKLRTGLTITTDHHTYTGKKALTKLLLSKQFIMSVYFLSLIFILIFPRLINRFNQFF